MQMKSWQLAPRYSVGAIVESFVRLSTPQPDRTTTSSASRKTRLQNPHSKLYLRLDKFGTKPYIMLNASTRLVWRLRHQHNESILARPIRKAAQYFKVISMRHETST
jgi:hypothetical protein